MLAVVCTAVAALLHWEASGVLEGTRYLAFYPAVVAAAAFGGAGPGLVATAGSVLCVDLLFDSPGRIDLADPVVLWRHVIFILGGVGTSLMAEMQRAAQFRARRHAEKLRLHAAALEAAANGIVITDTKGTIVWANRAFEAITGYGMEDILGHNPRFLKSGRQDKVFYQNLWETIERGKVWHGELVNRRKDGTLYDEEMTITPVRDERGDISHFIAIKQDVTARKRAEEALRNSEQRLRATFNNAGVGIVEVEAEDRFVAVNDRACEILGYSSDELLRLNVHELTAPEDRVLSDQLNAELHDGVRDRIQYAKRYLRRDGTSIWVQVTVSAVRDVQGRWVRSIATVEDISQRKAAEEELRASQEDLNRAQAVAHIGSWRLDVRRNRLLWSDENHRIFGIPKGTSLTYETFLATVHPEDRAMVDAKWRTALRGEPYDIEHRIVVGGEVKWVHQRAGLEFDGDGKLLGAFGTTQDITERKRVEEALAAAIRSAECAKAAAEEASRAKDHFLAVLSHELRTPLTPVLATVSMLQAEGWFDHDTRQSLEVIRRNTELEARLIDDLLDITRIARGKVELDKRVMPLCEVIMQAVEVCQPDIEARRQHFGVDLGSGLPYLVEADAARLQQVFWNLLKNAIKFTPPGGHVGVRCRPDDSGAVLIEVHDSGEGIEREALGRIFNAFEQAERSITRQFGGLGLGLAISKALVEMHGGRIEAHSEGKGKGATFRVRLPLVSSTELKVLSTELGGPSAASKQDSALSTQHSSLSRPLRVLLVEDHGDTARIMTRLLARRGHEVKAAGDVASALALADLSGFDLLVSDLGLPDRSGLDLIRELRSRGQMLPAIALSGYGQEEDVRRSREAGFNAHLTKPVDFEQFYRTIAAVTELPTKSNDQAPRPNDQSMPKSE